MKDKMTFTDLVEKIATETGSTKKLVHDLLIETIALNRNGLENDGNNNIPSLGRFSLKWQKSRKGRNPKSGEIIDIPAHNTLNFKALTTLRNHINRQYAYLKPQLIKLEAIDIKDDHIETPIMEVKAPLPIIEKKAPPPIAEVKAPPPIVEVKAPPPIAEVKSTPPIAEVKSTPPIAEVKSTPPIAEVKASPLAEMPAKEIKQDEKIRVQPNLKKPLFSPTKTKKSIFRWWWLFILLLIIILIIIFYLFRQFSDSEIIIEEQPTEISTISKEVDLQKQPDITTGVEAQTPDLEKNVGGNTFGEGLTFPAGKYKVQANDYLFRIAKNHYKEASFWPIIYRANHAQLLDPNILMPGSEISLPAMQGFAGNLSEKDKKDIANGYMEVYLFYKDTNRNKALYHLWVAKKLDITMIEEYADRINSEDLDSVNSITGEIEF